VITFSLYPEPLFGGAMRLLLFTLLPAGFVGYLPARLARAPSLAVTFELAAAAVVYSGLAWCVFNRGLRTYSSGSRFEFNGEASSGHGRSSARGPSWSRGRTSSCSRLSALIEAAPPSPPVCATDSSIARHRRRCG
jgi:hypothetical protein